MERMALLVEKMGTYLSVAENLHEAQTSQCEESAIGENAHRVRSVRNP